MTSFKDKLELIYRKYNKFELIGDDPLGFIYDYNDKYDREIVGLIAASLAYGKVSQIHSSVKKILKVFGISPRNFILNNNSDFFTKAFARFKHRFTTGGEIAFLLTGIKNIIQKHGSLEKCFLSFSAETPHYLDVVTRFVSELAKFFPEGKTYLIPSPSGGSACKKLMLYLRWMIRRDEVDPGCWANTTSEKLIIPLDTHMFSIAKTLGFTQRKSADMKTAQEITRAFSQINKKDPVKYDFALTRFGIRDDFEYTQLFDIVNSNSG